MLHYILGQNVIRPKMEGGSGGGGRILPISWLLHHLIRSDYTDHRVNVMRHVDASPS
jgi:hypothetical protein